MINMNDSLDFKVNINNFNGSLEVLLDLAKSQKVDLETISITKLADQFLEFIKNTENVNLELASEYLLMATWLTYLKSKLLLPESEEEEFKALEVAEKLKIQLKKLELIRLLSDQMLKRKRLGKDIFFRGMKGNIKSIYSSKYSLTLYEILKTYSTIVMTKDFQTMNIPKLPVLTTEEGIKRIKNLFGNLKDWKSIYEIVPKVFYSSNNLKKTGLSGIFSGSLELAKEGNISIKQNKLFDDVFIKEKNE
jgi:segregation and condensation protein A